MKRSGSLQQTLERIAKDKCYGELSQFADENSWSDLTSPDREALALLFVKRGEMELRDGKQEAHDSLRRASDIAPSSPKVHYRKGMTYLLQPLNVAYWALAIRSFKEAVRISPNCTDAWHGWANALIRMGNYHGEVQYLNEADEVFEKGTEQASNVPLSAEYYWHWGLAWYHIGKLSGEASDFCRAMEKYRQAADKHLQKAAFWNDYGNALVEFGVLAGRQELLFDATELYRKAIKDCPDLFEAWLNLACGYQCLFEMAGGDALFKLAEESFQRASEIDSEDVTVWLKWAMLLASAGRNRQDVRKLEESLDLFRRADACEPNHSLVLARWGEALMWFGSLTDRHDLLRTAEERILRSIELAPENAHTWYLYGACHQELALYFSDQDFFNSSIEKFDYGLSLHPDHPELLYGKAQSTALLAATLGDLALLREANGYFNAAHDAGAGKDARFWNDWGVALMRLGEVDNKRHWPEEAVSRFEHAIQLQGGEQDVTSVDTEILYNYGCALDFLGDYSDELEHYQRAVEVLEKVVLLDPDYDHARYNLGLAWLHMGEVTTDVDCLHKAIAQFEMVNRLDPEDELTLNDWGLAQLTLSQLVDEHARPGEADRCMAAAEEHLRAAIALGGMQSYYNLACLYSLRESYDAALHFIQRAEQVGALPDIDDIMNDEWLEGLRGTDEFQRYIAHLVEER